MPLKLNKNAKNAKKTKLQIVDCGRLSKEYSKKVLKNLPGKLLIESISIDHYNRILVKVYKGNVDIAKLMVEAGMAFSYRGIYRQEEDLAKAEKLGFWGFYTPPIQPFKWRKINRR